jgi:hypothetical protein
MKIQGQNSHTINGEILLQIAKPHIITAIAILMDIPKGS